MSGIKTLNRTTPILFFIILFVLSAGTTRAEMLQQWVASYNGPDNNNDWGYDVAADADGNFYVTGYSKDDAGVMDAFLAKYTKAGALDWAQRWDGPNHAEDRGYQLAIGEDGVYVAGYTTTATYYYDALLLKYDTDGTLLWEETYDKEGFNDLFNSIVIDDAGDIYVAGWSDTSAALDDYLLAKYDSSGTQQWVRFDNDSNNCRDYAWSLAVDDGGNAYVGGVQADPSGYAVAVVKFNADGDFQWKRTQSGSVDGDDIGGSLVLSGQGVYYEGSYYLEHTPDNDDLGLSFVNADNTDSWERFYDGPGNNDDFSVESYASLDVAPYGIRGVAAATDGSVYVTGSAQNADGDLDVTVLKYDADGNLLWSQLYDAGDGVNSFTTGIVVDAEGRPYACAIQMGPATYDYVIVSYTADGTFIDAKNFNGPDDETDFASAIALDPDGNPVVTGMGRQGTDERYNAYTVKYCIGCLIDNVCYPDGALSKESSCFICDASADQTDWSDNNGAPCDDGKFCNGPDTCDAGSCSQHAGEICPDDGLFCTGTETCIEADEQCVSSGDPCETGTECNEDTDSCDPLADDDSADDDSTDDASDDETDDQADDQTDDSSDDDADTLHGNDDDDEGGCCGC